MFFEQRIYPMEPVYGRINSVIDTPGYAYQVKWDGIRLLAFGKGEQLRLQSRSLKDKTAHYPELTVLLQMVKGKSFILDGELIALREGRPSFYTVMQRESASVKKRRPPGHPLDGGGKGKIAVVYMLFDLLYLEGAWLTETPWEKRQELLFNLIRDKQNELVCLTPAVDQGDLLLKAVVEKGLEGLVAKKKDGPYVAGPRKSSNWLKIKVEQTIEALVCGITCKGERPVSLILGLEDENNPAFTGGASENKGSIKDDSISNKKMRYIGSVSSGLTAGELNNWKKWALENSLPSSLFFNEVLLPGKNIIWTKPLCRLKVTFNEWTPGLKLRAPRLQ